MSAADDWSATYAGLRLRHCGHCAHRCWQGCTFPTKQRRRLTWKAERRCPQGTEMSSSTTNTASVNRFAGGMNLKISADKTSRRAPIGFQSQMCTSSFQKAFEDTRCQAWPKKAFCLQPGKASNIHKLRWPDSDREGYLDQVLLCRGRLTAPSSLQMAFVCR